MKILVTSKGKTINDEIDPRFGRCNYFIIVEKGKREKVKAVRNIGKNESHGAGLIAAEQAGNLSPDAIITGRIGPNAFMMLNRLNIKIYTSSGNIEKAIENFLKNALNEIKNPARSHFGLGQKEKKMKPKESRIRLAVCADKKEVSHHFGRSPEFIFADIIEGKVIAKKIIKNPGHRTGFLPKYLSEEGITYVIAGGAGPMAISLFKEYNIKMILGITGIADKVIDEFAKGKLKSKKKSLCNPRTAKKYGVEKEDK